MKKLSVLILAAALVLVFTLPAAAVEHQFGGYWRVRAVTQQKFSGEDDTEAMNRQQVDSRTRLYYTAKFTDNLKFVNKFEFDSVWGDTVLGDFGADGKELEIKNSYVDFNLGPTNFKIGIQGYALARGFLLDDDFSGLVLNYNAGGWNLPFIWIKAYEGGVGKNKNDEDVDYFALNPTFKLGDWKVNPYFLYVYSDKGSSWSSTASYDDVNIYYIGANIDGKLGGWNLWGTGIYNGGDAKLLATGLDQNFKGYLFAAGTSGAVGPFGLRGQFFWASGDDNPADNDQDAFTPPKGRSYYWSEIMGYGIFDHQVSANSPADGISNIWALNAGADYQLTESLKASLDLWYASLVEKGSAADEVLGTELNLKATYKVMPNLNLDVVGAYLFRGDGTYKGPGESDPYELGARLSLSF